MKYLTLNNHELKKLLYLRREQLIIYLATLFIIILGSFIFLQMILKILIITFIVIIFSISYTTFILYNNRKYLKELFHQQKKVYKGAISFKTVYKKNHKRKYVFNVDGHNFYVDRTNFEKLHEGDVIELHVSSSTKYLFRIEKAF